MKAKDYAKEYREKIGNGRDPVDVIVRDILPKFVDEFAILTRTRGKDSCSAALACYHEIDDKYKSFCNLISTKETEYKFSGFYEYLCAMDPDMKVLLRQLELEARYERPSRPAGRQ